MNICDTYLLSATEPVALATPEQQQEAESLAASMLEAMRRLGGIGLAANQVGVPASVFVMSALPQREFCFFNPQIIATSNQQCEFAEGCLSYPGESIKLTRSEIVQLMWHTSANECFMDLFEGIEARVILHEMDHLMGITMHDRQQQQFTNPLEKQLEQ